MVVRGIYIAIYTRQESVCVWAWYGMRGAVCAYIYIYIYIYVCIYIGVSVHGGVSVGGGVGVGVGVGGVG